MEAKLFYVDATKVPILAFHPRTPTRDGLGI